MPRALCILASRQEGREAAANRQTRALWNEHNPYQLWKQDSVVRLWLTHQWVSGCELLGRGKFQKELAAKSHMSSAPSAAGTTGSLACLSQWPLHQPHIKFLYNSSIEHFFPQFTEVCFVLALPWLRFPCFHGVLESFPLWVLFKWCGVERAWLPESEPPGVNPSFANPYQLSEPGRTPQHERAMLLSVEKH